MADVETQAWRELDEFRGFNPKFDAALDALTAQIEELERERDDQFRSMRLVIDSQIARAETTEQENERLKEALAVVWGQLAHQMDDSLAAEVRAALTTRPAPLARDPEWKVQEGC